MDLDTRFQATLDRLGTTAPKDFLAPYGAPGRHYHTLEHLTYCFDLLDSWAIPHTPIFELALWAHDLVYDPSRRDNEAQSVKATLAQITLTPAQEAEFTGLVMATCHLTTPVQREDHAQIIDLDLAILSDRGRYPSYAKAIRAEYSMYPDEAYRQGRLRALTSFVNQTWIYRTADFRVDREIHARWNLYREIEELGNGS